MPPVHRIIIAASSGPLALAGGPSVERGCLTHRCQDHPPGLDQSIGTHDLVHLGLTYTGWSASAPAAPSWRPAPTGRCSRTPVAVPYAELRAGRRAARPSPRPRHHCRPSRGAVNSLPVRFAAAPPSRPWPNEGPVDLDFLPPRNCQDDNDAEPVPSRDRDSALRRAQPGHHRPAASARRYHSVDLQDDCFVRHPAGPASRSRRAGRADRRCTACHGCPRLAVSGPARPHPAATSTASSSTRRSLGREFGAVQRAHEVARPSRPMPG